MPVYEYLCEKCQATTEAIRKMDDADTPLVCQACGSDQTHRTHSVFMARGSSDAQPSPPSGGCGRCGDPHGPCGM